MPGTRSAGIGVFRTSCVGVSRTRVCRGLRPQPRSIRRIGGHVAPCAVVLRVLLRHALLRRVLPLLILVLALIAVLPLLILVLTLVLALILLPGILALNKAHSRLRRKALCLTALAKCRDGSETKEQDCRGDHRRTHSFRVCSPVHVSFSRRPAEMSIPGLSTRP